MVANNSVVTCYRAGVGYPGCTSRLRRLLQSATIAVHGAQDGAVRAPGAGCERRVGLANCMLQGRPDAGRDARRVARDDRTKQFKWVGNGKHHVHIFEDGWADTSFNDTAKGEPNIFAEFSPGDDFVSSTTKTPRFRLSKASSLTNTARTRPG